MLLVVGALAILVHATGDERFVELQIENGAAHAGHCKVSESEPLLKANAGGKKLAVKLVTFDGTLMLWVAIPPSDQTMKL